MVLAILTLTALWGGNAVALRYSVQELPPIGAAGARFAIGLVFFLIIATVHKVPLRLPRAMWAPLLWMGALFTVQIILLNLGSARDIASRQALLINSHPLLVPLLAHFWLPDDRLTREKVYGTAIAFLGVLLLFREALLTSPEYLVGDLLITASAALLAVKAIYTRALVANYHPYQILVWQMAVAVPIFLTASLLREGNLFDPALWTPAVGGAILYQGVVVAGVCFLWWTTLLKHYPPGRLTVGFFATPIFGALFGYLILKEPISGALAGAIVAVGVGIAVTNGALRRVMR